MAAPKKKVRKSGVSAKPAAVKQLSLGARIHAFWIGENGIITLCMLAARQVRSPRSDVRRMAVLFVSSLGGLAVVGGVGGGKIYQWRVDASMREQALKAALAAQQVGENIGDFVGKRAEEAKRRNTTMVVGVFEMEVVEGNMRSPNSAELEIVVECDDKPTCDHIQKNGTPVRNEILSALSPMSREELLSREGKARLKRQIIERLNAFVPSGKIENVYFTRLVVG